MKKILTLIAAAAVLAVSCQKETPATDNTGSSSSSGKLTATIVKTKVSYDETAGMNLQPAWEIGDRIIGFDDAGNTYTLTVASVSAETATLSGSVPDGAMHLIYKSGAKAGDISSKKLTIDYKDQAGDKTMPAVMLSDGIVENGACDFKFKNAGAIIGIFAAKDVPQGSNVTKLTISGENLSTATVALSGSTLDLTATEKTRDAISVDGLDLTVTDANGTLSAPVFFAVPAGALITIVSATVSKEPETMKMPAATPQEGVDYVTIAGTKWAKWNLGAKSETDFGWHFVWGSTEGYVRYSDTWQNTTTLEFSYYPSPEHNTSASEYLYVKTQPFWPSGHNFEWYNTPSNNGSEDYDDSYFSGVRNTMCPGDVLAREYDAASVNWGGNWRIPTADEFQAMIDASYTALDATDYGCYVFAPDESHPAGGRSVSVPEDLNKTDALLFFPATGVGDGGMHLSLNSGRYWTSTLSSEPHTAHFFQFVIGQTYPNVNTHYRRFSLCVRPVLD